MKSARFNDINNPVDIHVQGKIVSTSVEDIVADNKQIIDIDWKGSADGSEDQYTINRHLRNRIANLENAGFLTEHQDISGKVNRTELARVATTGNYNDLNNKPTIITEGDIINLINNTISGDGGQTPIATNSIFGKTRLATGFDDINSDDVITVELIKGAGLDNNIAGRLSTLEGCCEEVHGTLDNIDSRLDNLENNPGGGSWQDDLDVIGNKTQNLENVIGKERAVPIYIRLTDDSDAAATLEDVYVEGFNTDWLYERKNVGDGTKTYYYGFWNLVTESDVEDGLGQFILSVDSRKFKIDTDQSYATFGGVEVRSREYYDVIVHGNGYLLPGSNIYEKYSANFYSIVDQNKWDKPLEYKPVELYLCIKNITADEKKDFVLLKDGNNPQHEGIVNTYNINYNQNDSGRKDINLDSVIIYYKDQNQYLSNRANVPSDTIGKVDSTVENYVNWKIEIGGKSYYRQDYSGDLIVETSLGKIYLKPFTRVVNNSNSTPPPSIWPDDITQGNQRSTWITFAPQCLISLSQNNTFSQKQTSFNVVYEDETHRYVWTVNITQAGINENATDPTADDKPYANEYYASQQYTEQTVYIWEPDYGKTIKISADNPVDNDSQICHDVQTTKPLLFTFTHTVGNATSSSIINNSEIYVDIDQNYGNYKVIGQPVIKSLGNNEYAVQCNIKTPDQQEEVWHLSGNRNFYVYITVVCENQVNQPIRYALNIIPICKLGYTSDKQYFLSEINEGGNRIYFQTSGGAEQLSMYLYDMSTKQQVTDTQEIEEALSTIKTIDLPYWVEYVDYKLYYTDPGIIIFEFAAESNPYPSDRESSFMIYSDSIEYAAISCAQVPYDQTANYKFYKGSTDVTGTIAYTFVIPSDGLNRTYPSTALGPNTGVKIFNGEYDSEETNLVKQFWAYIQNPAASSNPNDPAIKFVIDQGTFEDGAFVTDFHGVNGQRGGTYNWFEFRGFNTANSTQNAEFDGFMRAHFICSGNTSTSSRDVYVRIRYKSSSDLVPVCYFRFHQLGLTQKYGDAYGDSDFNVIAKNYKTGVVYDQSPIVLSDGKLECKFDVESNTTWSAQLWQTKSDYIIDESGTGNWTSVAMSSREIYNGSGDQTVNVTFRALNTSLYPWYFVAIFKSSDTEKEPIEIHIQVNPDLDQTTAMHLYCGPYAAGHGYALKISDVTTSINQGTYDTAIVGVGTVVEGYGEHAGGSLVDSNGDWLQADSIYNSGLRFDVSSSPSYNSKVGNLITENKYLTFDISNQDPTFYIWCCENYGEGIKVTTQEGDAKEYLVEKEGVIAVKLSNSQTGTEETHMIMCHQRPIITINTMDCQMNSLWDSTSADAPTLVPTAALQYGSTIYPVESKDNKIIYLPTGNNDALEPWSLSSNGTQIDDGVKGLITPYINQNNDNTFTLPTSNGGEKTFSIIKKTCSIDGKEFALNPRGIIRVDSTDQWGYNNQNLEDELMRYGQIFEDTPISYTSIVGRPNNIIYAASSFAPVRVLSSYTSSIESQASPYIVNESNKIISHSDIKNKSVFIYGNGIKKETHQQLSNKTESGTFTLNILHMFYGPVQNPIVTILNGPTSANNM